MRSGIAPDVLKKLEKSASIFEALGSPTRQRILWLFERGEQINIKTIAEQFNLSRTAVVHHIGVLQDAYVVHHIGVLQDAGLLKGERVGKEVIMYADWSLLNKTLKAYSLMVDKEYAPDELFRA